MESGGHTYIQSQLPQYPNGFFLLEIAVIKIIYVSDNVSECGNKDIGKLFWIPKMEREPKDVLTGTTRHISGWRYLFEKMFCDREIAQLQT